MLNEQNPVLKYLLENKDSYTSGQKLADSLGLSRNAIWKAIQKYRKEGFEITSKTKNGYCLLAYPKNFHPGLLKLLMNQRGIPLNIYFKEEVTSTNELVKGLFVPEQDEEGSLLVAKKQTQGRGRRGKKFYSNLAGGYYLSLAIKPKNIGMEEIPLYTILTAASLVLTLEDYVPQQLMIKWVNDIFYDRKKIAGILTEMQTDVETNDITHLIIGLGLNLYGDFDQAASDVKAVAGTLFGAEAPEHFNINQFFLEFLTHFFYFQEHFSKRLFLSPYRNHLMGLHQHITYQIQGQEREGTILGINDLGHLQVKNKAGKLETLYGQEISLGSKQFTKH